MNVFDEMGSYWAEIADGNQTDRQVNFIKNSLKPPGVILDLACGTGRHLIPLSKEGYSVVGLDISSKLLLIAKSRWREAQLVIADMRFLPFKPEAFAAAISMDTSFGYLATMQDDLQSLCELNAILRKSGVLVVDVFNRERLIKRYKANNQPKWREYPSFYLLQERTITADGSFLLDMWTIQDKADGHNRVFEHIARLYMVAELQTLLEKTCFTVNAVYGDYDGQNFKPTSSRLILMATTT
jgi:ubiquinone/menaquinone biosynthesis C-methylase UbiE